jgi:hypothetical protein
MHEIVAGPLNRMRTGIAIAGLAVGIIVGSGVARAAEIPPSDHVAAPGAYPLVGHRAVPYDIYDFEPGIVVRPYWLQPWAYRHYYPRGRDVRSHRVRAVARRPRLAEPYERYWSTDPLIVEEVRPYYEPPPPFRPGFFGP